MVRTVFDTVIFVRALINPHSICGRLVFAHAERYRLFVSPPVLMEILEVLQRPELVTRFRTLQGLDMARVSALLGQAESVEVPTVPAVGRDPKDDKFLATAVAAGADYLVTEDLDLLVIGNHQGTQIVNAAAFMRALAAER